MPAIIIAAGTLKTGLIGSKLAVANSPNQSAINSETKLIRTPPISPGITAIIL